ncbi:(deoxy)nucleoside triphosphate pyrophosphohydrolase [Flexivirga alba]|uniref:8-oxo-dGTP diphosphatase n=1 Tax=Flexivirga alba TaxID=702742 RepID=A0ABW2AE74_9MICO
MIKQIDVVGAVLVRDGTVLAAQRGPSMALSGHWEFPGGKVEQGESPQEALVRELREELLCDIAVGDRVETTSHQYDFGIVTLTTYLATLEAGEPQATEHAELRWIPVADLHSVEWAPADVPAVERIMQLLAK